MCLITAFIIQPSETAIMSVGRWYLIFVLLNHGAEVYQKYISYSFIRYKIKENKRNEGEKEKRGRERKRKRS